jgi:hypothetical protein
MSCSVLRTEHTAHTLQKDIATHFRYEKFVLSVGTFTFVLAASRDGRTTGRMMCDYCDDGRMMCVYCDDGRIMCDYCGQDDV